MISDRVPPHSLDAEQSVIGGVMLSPAALSSVLERGITHDDFYHPAHRVIFEAMEALERASRPIDMLTVADTVRALGRDIADLEGMLADLACRVPTVENIGYYAGIVRDKATRRAMIATAADILAKGYSDGEETPQFLDWAESRVSDVAHRSERESYVSVKRLALEVYKDIEERHRRGTDVTGVPTGWVDLDRMLCGLQPSDLILLAARPSMGKTAMALNIAEHAAAKQRIPTLIFSLEMSRKQLIERMMCSGARIDSQKVRTGKLPAGDWPSLLSSTGAVSESLISIDASSSPTAMEIRAKARRWRSDKTIFPTGNEFGLIIVDYLQMMRGSGREERKDLEVGEISRSLKSLAKDLRVPVLALSQLNRSVEKREDKRPMMSHLRESGNLEQDADVILFIYRDCVYNKTDDPDHEAAAEVIIGKQRNGPTGTVNLSYLKHCTRFENATQREAPPEPPWSRQPPERDYAARDWHSDDD